MNLFELLGTIAITGADKANEDIDKTTENASSLGENLKKGITTVAKWGAAIGTAAIAGGTALSKLASDFEEAFAKTTTLLNGSESEMNAYKDAIVKASNETGISTEDMSEAVYNAISAGVDQADAINFVTDALQLAKGGFTDTTTAVDIMTTALNAYNLESDQAKRVTDVLITTQNLGKTTVDELASSMGKVIPIASAYGVDIENLGASYATLTAGGIATAEATTYMKSMFTELADAGSDISAVITDKTGKSFSELMDEGYSVGDVLKIVYDSVNGNSTAFANLWASTEAGTGALAVVNAGAEAFNETLGSMKDSSGATEKAYKKMDDTIASKMKKMKNNIKNMGTTLGQKLLPFVEKLLNIVTDNLPNIQAMIDKLTPAFETLFDSLIPVITDLIDDFLPVIMSLISDLIPVISKLIPIVSGLLEVLKPILDVVIAILQPVLDLAGQGISALAEAFGFATEKVDAAVQAARDEAQAMENVRIAADNARQAVDDKAAAELASLSTTESLWSELQTLADEQGNVAEKDKARAEFLTGQLAEALGIEIEWTGNQIQNYKDLQTEIDNTIEKKKAEILLAASEENYAAAIKNRSEAEQNLTTATQNRAAAMDELQRLQEQGYTIDDECYKNALDRAASTQEAYADAKLTVKGYYDDIAEYETAQSLMLQGQTDEAIDLLSQQGKAFQTASELASESAEEQQRILEGQLEDAALKMQVQYDLLSGLSDDCSESQRKTYEDAFKQSQEYFANSVTEYEKSGGTIGESFFKSISEKMGVEKFKTVGSYIVDGIAQGASGSKYSLINTMNSLIDDVINAPRKRASGGTSGGGRAGGGTSGTPHMAKGGVLKKGQVGFLEGDGDEAVVPLSQNTEWIDKVADKINNRGGGDLSAKLDQLIKAITSMNIVLDTGAMVGEMAPAMDAQLGDIYVAKERGRQ